MKRLFALAVFALALIACPRSPVTPDGGTDVPDAGQIADAGVDVVDAAPDVVDARPDVVDAAPDVVPAATCKRDGSKCCRTCTALAAHSCPEGKPTALGKTCEDVCQATESGPSALRTPDVSSCADLACIRRGLVACKGGT